MEAAPSTCKNRYDTAGMLILVNRKGLKTALGELRLAHNIEDFTVPSSYASLNGGKSITELLCDFEHEKTVIRHVYPTPYTHNPSPRSISIFVPLSLTNGSVTAGIDLSKYFPKDVTSIVPIEIEVKVQRCDSLATTMCLDIFARKFTTNSKQPTKRTRVHLEHETKFTQQEFVSWTRPCFNITESGAECSPSPSASSSSTAGINSSNKHAGRAGLVIDDSAELSSSDDEDQSVGAGRGGKSRAKVHPEPRTHVRDNIPMLVDAGAVNTSKVVFTADIDALADPMYPRMMVTHARDILKELHAQMSLASNTGTATQELELDLPERNTSNEPNAKRKLTLKFLPLEFRNDPSRQTLLAWFWMRYGLDVAIKTLRELGVSEEKIVDTLQKPIGSEAGSSSSVTFPQSASSSSSSSSTAAAAAADSSIGSVSIRRVPYVFLCSEISKVFKRYNLNDFVMPIRDIAKNPNDLLYFKLKPIDEDIFRRQTAIKNREHIDAKVQLVVNILADVRCHDSDAERSGSKDFDTVYAWDVEKYTIEELEKMPEF